MGRRPIGKRPMTPAERKQRQRRKEKEKSSKKFKWERQTEHLLNFLIRSEDKRGPTDPKEFELRLFSLWFLFSCIMKKEEVRCTDTRKLLRFLKKNISQSLVSEFCHYLFKLYVSESKARDFYKKLIENIDEDGSIDDMEAVDWICTKTAEEMKKTMDSMWHIEDYIAVARQLYRGEGGR